MTKHGSNDLKKRARELAEAEGIRYTEALSRLRHGTPSAPANAGGSSAANRWKHHSLGRGGFHWYSTTGAADLRVDVPDRQNPVWRRHLAELVLDRWDGAVPRFEAKNTHMVLDRIREAFGRTGREPVEHVDIDLHLDPAQPQGRLNLVCAGLLLAHATEHESWKTPRLTACELKTGELHLVGEGSDRRITWAVGTVLNVHDVPRTSLQELDADAYEITATSFDDPHDALRREAHRLLGMRYRSDIPPAPQDATDGRPPTLVHEWPASMHQLATDYPHGTQPGERLVVDTTAQLVYVRRTGMVGLSEYALPLTSERLAVIDELEKVFGQSDAAYACAGANAATAAILRGTEFTPHRLYHMLRLMVVRDAEDAAALVGRSEEAWAESGWSLRYAQPVYQDDYKGADPSKCLRASEAAQFAEAGINAARAYESSTEKLAGTRTRHRSVAEAIAYDLTVPNDSGQLAISLLLDIPGVPAALAAELRLARRHTSTEVTKWEHRVPSLWGMSSGMAVTLDRLDFTLADGSVRHLWTVTDAEWGSNGEDADAWNTVSAFLDEKEARGHYRSATAGHQKQLKQVPAAAAKPPVRPCPAVGTKHCDNCGATAPHNPWLPTDFWMSASLGLACGPDCYDAMADEIGEHARLFHGA